VTSPNPTPDGAATVLVKDVVEFELSGPYEWNGGSVTMRLHEGRLDGEPIYFVRTDASDEAFASEDQVSVLSTGPGRDDLKGTPDAGGQDFIVNCPSPIVAPTTSPAVMAGDTVDRHGQRHPVRASFARPCHRAVTQRG
jgi:hypothetical protein